MSPEKAPRQRLTADARRESILKVAVIEFAKYGLHGTSTVTIAEQAGISQPYLFRLFSTKKKLFTAAAKHVQGNIAATFRDAAADQPEDKLHAMGHAYQRLLERRFELLFILQVFSASADEEVKEVARQALKSLYTLVVDLTGATESDIQAFMAKGMLMTVAASVDLPAIAETEAWVKDLLA